MSTFTTEEYAQYMKFVELHAKEVARYIVSCGHDFTPESICKLGNFDAKKAFMDFPDYDENNPLETADSLVVLYFAYVEEGDDEEDIEFIKLWEFFDDNLDYSLSTLSEEGKLIQ